MLNKSSEFLPCHDGPIFQRAVPFHDGPISLGQPNQILQFPPLRHMNPLDFCYWLQGLMEVGDPKTLNETQVQHIKNHLNMVFENKAGLVEQVIYASC